MAQILSQIRGIFQSASNLTREGAIDRLRKGAGGIFKTAPYGAHPDLAERQLTRLGNMKGAVPEALHKGFMEGKTSSEIFKEAKFTTDQMEEARKVVGSVRSKSGWDTVGSFITGRKWHRTLKDDDQLANVTRQKISGRNASIKDKIENAYRQNKPQPSSENTVTMDGRTYATDNPSRRAKTANAIRQARNDSPITYTNEDVYNWSSPLAVQLSRAAWGTAGAIGLGATVGAKMIYSHQTENYQQYNPSLIGNTPLAGDGSLGLMISNNRRPY